MRVTPALKYRNRPTVVHGIRFASAKEAARYQDLCWLEKSGEITGLRVQPRYDLIVQGVKVATYVGDFEYHEQGQKIVEDVKSPITRKLPEYRMKKALLRACYGLEVRET